MAKQSKNDIFEFILILGLCMIVRYLLTFLAMEMFLLIYFERCLYSGLSIRQCVFTCLFKGIFFSFRVYRSLNISTNLKLLIDYNKHNK